MAQVEKKEAFTKVIPGMMKVTLSFQELIIAIRSLVPDLPEGGDIEIRVNPDTQKVTIIHT